MTTPDRTNLTAAEQAADRFLAETLGAPRLRRAAVTPLPNKHVTARTLAARLCNALVHLERMNPVGDTDWSTLQVVIAPPAAMQPAQLVVTVSDADS